MKLARDQTSPETRSFDPAAELAEDGRPWLQVRLGLWGKVTSLVNIGYWIVWCITYARNDSEAALEIAPSFIVAGFNYGGLWLIGRGKPRPLRLLKAVDVVAHTLIGLSFAIAILTHPVPKMMAIEGLVGMMFLLFVRAVLIPSDPRRTLLVGICLVLPNIVLALVLRERLAPDGVVPTSYWVTFFTWCAIACGVCTVASHTLYGLGRQVHDARRLGQYTLLEELGRGGMGIVYRAQHAMLRRPTAIKLLSQGLSGGHERFEREVQLMAEISHPNIVTVHDYGRTSTGVFYYAMELLEGLDLERLVQFDGPQPAARVVHVMLQVSSALTRAHAAGLVHRDIKPGNIFLCRSWGEADTVKVLDFGLVKKLHESEDSKLTVGTKLLGTPLYMAPEAITDPSKVDGRADIYALGAVAYYMLVGEPVFRGHTVVEISAHHLHSKPPSVRERAGVSERLEQVIMRCLEKKVAQRFADADELRRALQDCPEVGAWKQEHANRWWAERPAERPKTNDSRAFLDTVLVDQVDR